MPDTFRILVINPGSTSTKVALFEDDRERFSVAVSHTREDLAPFARIADQFGMRRRIIEKTLSENGVDSRGIHAVVGRGGLLKPIVGGVYTVNKTMVDDLTKAERGEHASNLGALIAFALAGEIGCPAYIVDPVVVDELDPVARMSGLPGLERISIFHALNQRAVAKKAAAAIGRSYESLRLIVVHLGGGISVGCHRDGRVVDVNNALDGDGPFSPERAGGLPSGQLAQWCFSGRDSHADIKKKLTGQGGLVAHLGTNDIRAVRERIRKGDDRARLVVEAMVYQVAKQIGASAAVLDGRVDAVVLSGGLALDADLVQDLTRKITWIARVFVYPGEEEMPALAVGALDVLRGRSKARTYA